MDTGKGEFKEVSAKDENELIKKMCSMEALFPDHGGWFRVGDTVTFNNIVFRIKAVKATELILTLKQRLDRSVELSIGDTIELNGSRFRVKSARYKKVRLKLLSRKPQFDPEQLKLLSRKEQDGQEQG